MSNSFQSARPNICNDIGITYNCFSSLLYSFLRMVFIQLLPTFPLVISFQKHLSDCRYRDQVPMFQNHTYFGLISVLYRPPTLILVHLRIEWLFNIRKKSIICFICDSNTSYMYLIIIIIIIIGGLVAQAVRRSPPTAGVPSSRLGPSMWVSWWTKRDLGRFSEESYLARNPLHIAI